MISIEGMPPGEYRGGGTRLGITVATHATRFGQVLIASTGRGICAISFMDGKPGDESQAALQHCFPQATFRQGTDAHQKAALSWFTGHPADPEPVNLHLRGTPFQLTVWEKLLEVPPGRLATYADMADALGKPGAARAVGSAIGSNPVALLIPCHRVIRASGALGGYRWGLSRKAELIGLEATQYRTAYGSFQ